MKSAGVNRETLGAGPAGTMVIVLGFFVNGTTVPCSRRCSPLVGPDLSWKITCLSAEEGRTASTPLWNSSISRPLYLREVLDLSSRTFERFSTSSPLLLSLNGALAACSKPTECREQA